jgi:hypothetical protein
MMDRITGDIIKNFNPYSIELVEQFEAKYPDGLDASRLLGTVEERKAFWHELFDWPRANFMGNIGRIVA